MSQIRFYLEIAALITGTLGTGMMLSAFVVMRRQKGVAAADEPGSPTGRKLLVIGASLNILFGVLLLVSRFVTTDDGAAVSINSAHH